MAPRPPPSVIDREFADVSLVDEIACITRELAMRERLYPNWVRHGRMDQGVCNKELRRMQAVLKRLLLAQKEAG